VQFRRFSPATSPGVFAVDGYGLVMKVFAGGIMFFNCSSRRCTVAGEERLKLMLRIRLHFTRDPKQINFTSISVSLKMLFKRQDLLPIFKLLTLS